ncbi:hypothetical protein BsIDN1_41410 [Bacillus safensis]|uniref:Uncharacterized protein n=1 Tax=Bacillus safensis TaxID=561879 RepID=A0A5S9MBN3_BACIA|nr:hypothetical protein BsIDN1_41410 [Bacillus safensis]
MEFSLSFFFGQASQEGAQSRVTEFIQKERTFQKGKTLYIYISLSAIRSVRFVLLLNLRNMSPLSESI